MEISEEDRLNFCKAAVTEAKKNHPDIWGTSQRPDDNLGYIGTYSGAVADYAIRYLNILKENRRFLKTNNPPD